MVKRIKVGVDIRPGEVPLSWCNKKVWLCQFLFLKPELRPGLSQSQVELGLSQLGLSRVVPTKLYSRLVANSGCPN